MTGSAMKTSWFIGFSRHLATLVGRPVTFISALVLVVIWGLSGPLFGFNDTWQIIINTITSIVTFLMIFLIQNTQNRDTEAIQIKLDELIRATQGAHNALLNIENLDEHQLEEFRHKYEQLAKKAKKAIEEGVPDTDSPHVDHSTSK